MVKNIFNKFFNANFDKPLKVYRQLYYFIDNERFHSDLSDQAKEIIECMNASLTKRVVDKLQALKPKPESVETELLAAGAVEQGVFPNKFGNGTKLLPNDTFTSITDVENIEKFKDNFLRSQHIGIDPLNAFLIGLLDQSIQVKFSETHKGILRVVIPRMANDIYFKGFFNPRELGDESETQSANLFIKSIKTELQECNTEGGTTPPESFSTKPANGDQLIPKDEGNEDEDPFSGLFDNCWVCWGFLPGGH